jgi:hypothetical protein
MPKLPFSIETADPCSESWESMSGDQQSRYCAQCDRAVHNTAGMTRGEVERLALRIAMGESLCARITRRADGELVTLPDMRAPLWLSTRAVLTAALAVTLPASARQTASDLPGRAVLRGRVVRPDGKPLDPKPAWVELRPENGGAVIRGETAADGSFFIQAPPGEYTVVARASGHMEVQVRGASLHQGEQSVGELHADSQPGNDNQPMLSTVGACIVVPVSPGYWATHPIKYVRYLGYKVRRVFSH